MNYKQSIKEFIRPYYNLVLNRRVDCMDYTLNPRISMQGGKKYCIITQPIPHAMGLFELWSYVATKAIYVIKSGYIPVVDMTVNQSIKGKNYWDLFFKQHPEAASLNDVYEGHGYIFFPDKYNRGFWDPVINPVFTSYYKSIYRDMGVKDGLLSEASLKIPDNTLGVPIRRSMERGIKTKHPGYTGYAGHHQRGRLDDYVREIEGYLKKYSYVFIAADDREALERMKSEFGNKCLFLERRLVHHFKNGTPVMRDNIKVFYEEYIEDGELMSYEQIHFISQTQYAIETYLLSRCSAILHNAGGQETMALIMNEDGIKIEDNYIFLGMME